MLATEWGEQANKLVRHNVEVLHKIFADFNNPDINGRIRLNTNASLNNIKEQNINLTPGLIVQLNDNDEFSISGIVEFSEEKIYG